MKKHLSFIIAVITASVFLPSCEEKSDDIIWDFAPIVFSISVTDHSGNDLLNSQTEGNIVGKGFRVLYNDNYFYLSDNSTETDATRYYMPHLYGAKIIEAETGYVLELGEFDGQKDCDITDIVVEWSDGSTDKFSYSNEVTWRKNKPKIKRYFYHNDKQVETSVISIIK